MPTYDYTCEVCGAQRRAWRPEGCPPRFCNKAHQAMGMAGQSRRPVKWPISPQMHEEIKKLYQNKVGMNRQAVVRQYAESIGYPRYKISRYAINQGWISKMPREPNWTEKELKILERSAHLSPDRIQVHLRRLGFRRSCTAIVLKRKRMRYTQNKEGQSAQQLSQCFGIDIHTILTWIKTGRLRAVKRGTARTAQQGGDIWFIKDKWIRQFILENLSQIDLRKVDKYWFVDLLAGKDKGIGPLAVETKQTATEDDELNYYSLSSAISQACGL